MESSAELQELGTLKSKHINILYRGFFSESKAAKRQQKNQGKVWLEQQKGEGGEMSERVSVKFSWERGKVWGQMVKKNWGRKKQGDEERGLRKEGEKEEGI